jgi:tripartite-type tricarboxylate transporter receptor subunit TctC
MSRLLEVLLMALCASGALAQDWPKQKPIHILVGFAPDWRSNTLGEFAAFLRDEMQKWSRAVKDSGATAD